MQARQCFPMLKAVFCVVVFAVLPALLSGCAETVEDVRLDGIEQFRSREYIASMATLRYALQKDPNDAEANYYMGLNYRALAERRFQQGDLPAARRTLDNAVVYFTQAIKTWPNYMAAIQAKNEALESRGKYDAALAVAEKQADVNRGIADHFVYLGDEYRERADYDNALRAYKTALAIDAENARAHEGMAKLHTQAGQQDLALQSFRGARDLNPSEQPSEAVVEAASVKQAEMASPAAPAAPAEPKPTRIYTAN